MSACSDDDDDETTLSQLLRHSSDDDDDDNNDDDSDDNDESSDDDDDDSSSNLSSSSSEEEPPDIFTQVGRGLTAAAHALVGTRESRFASRTNTTLKWKQDVAYEQAKTMYEAEKTAKRQADAAADAIRRLDMKREKKTKLQRRGNRKIARKMAKKIAACDLQHQKRDAKMTVVSEIRLHRLSALHAEATPVLATTASAPTLPITDFVKSIASRRLQEARDDMLAACIDEADALGRHCGMLPAIRTPPHVVPKEQLETATSLILRLAPPPDPKAPPKLKTLFTVNLKRFRHVEDCKGDHIGEAACIELGKSLLTGACPRLLELNLSWNDIKLRGVLSLAEAFKQGACGQMTRLDLRANSLDATALIHLFEALSKGGLPKLQHLLFAGNLVGDRGGKAVAHAFLAGALQHLVTIDLKSNGIKNDGCRAIYNACTADCFRRLGPSLELIDLRRNQINYVTAQSLTPCPKHISF
ncbi:hypothetical protein SDRG_15000 [Saprolegnia diclina VS20]|uniref:Uncharacterized protein n=1 Tax=Saprolegnia diclina (strain VS20) TaxID=1156394 RepID=T0R533_SAPDV|nr:hypothetical protein SDRG_15000 [Saprolegnia diclina VS20]EQC27198.1 hypothetical protein SDRG_15000 [Saprolegnia diclina VS20]|eukprot:XP_008619385.1 hypothetical protein SDRG_15000 [Saprolegnia diclina VS20]